MDLIVDPIEVKVNFSPGLCDREAWQEPACPMIMEKNSITATEIGWLGDGVDEPKGASLHLTILHPKQNYRVDRGSYRR
jgi:hypothetical protein